MMDKMKILIVDDNAELAYIIANALTNDGWGTIAAITVDEAMAAFDEHAPFMVVTDLRLSNYVDGVTMASKMHLKNPLTIFVAITGYASVFDVGYILGSVFTDVLLKPIDMDVLKQIVDYGADKRKRWEEILGK